MIKKKRQKPINDVPVNIISAAIALRRFICCQIDLKNYPARASATYLFQKSYSGLTLDDPSIVYFIVASLHLASKIYEESRPLNVIIPVLEKATQDQSIINVLPAIIRLPSFDEESRKIIYKNIVSAENDIVYNLDFSLKIQLPYSYAQNFARIIVHWHIPLDNQVLFDTLSTEIYDATYNLLTELQTSPIFYKYPPDIIAQAAIHVTFERLNLPLVSTHNLTWYGALLPFRDLTEMNEAYKLVSEYVQKSEMITPPQPITGQIEDIQLKMKGFFITPLEDIREIDEMCPPPPIELMNEIAGQVDGFNHLWADHLPSVPPPSLDLLKKIIPPSTSFMQRQKSDLASIRKEKYKKNRNKKKQKQKQKQKQQKQQQNNQNQQEKKINQNQQNINENYMTQNTKPVMQNQLDSNENQNQCSKPLIIFEPDEILITDPNHKGPPPPPPYQYPSDSSTLPPPPPPYQYPSDSSILPPPPPPYQYPSESSTLHHPPPYQYPSNSSILPPPPIEQQYMQYQPYQCQSLQSSFSYSYNQYPPQPQNYDMQCPPNPYPRYRFPFRQRLQQNKCQTKTNYNVSNQQTFCDVEDESSQNIPTTKKRKRKRKRKNGKKQQNENNQNSQKSNDEKKNDESHDKIDDGEQNNIQELTQEGKSNQVLGNANQSVVINQTVKDSNKKDNKNIESNENNHLHSIKNDEIDSESSRTYESDKSDQIDDIEQISQEDQSQNNQNDTNNQKKKRKRKRHKKTKNKEQDVMNQNNNKSNIMNQNNGNKQNIMNQNSNKSNIMNQNNNKSNIMNQNNNKSNMVNQNNSHKSNIMNPNIIKAKRHVNNYNQNQQGPFGTIQHQSLPNIYPPQQYQQYNHSYQQQFTNQYDSNFRFMPNNQQQMNFNFRSDQQTNIQRSSQRNYQNFNQFKNQNKIDKNTDEK